VAQSTRVEGEQRILDCFPGEAALAQVTYDHPGQAADARPRTSSLRSARRRANANLAFRTRCKEPLMVVVFDIGNVLVRWDRRYLYRKVFDDEERMDRFLTTALGMDFVSHTDVAEDFAAAVATQARSFPEFAKEIRMFHERWIETLGEPIEENVALLRRLRASGKPVYALSNFAHETFALAERKHDFLSEFDDRIISGHVGLVKPDAGIYEILFKRAGRRAGELLFIDDSPANVHASEALGMPAIHFGPGVDLEKELVARGALP
jgi:HAD superfamily hydrolase (TIGR01509 family)